MTGTNKENVEFRKLTPEEIDESIRLCCYAFQIDLPDQEWQAMREMLKADQHWAAIVDGQLAAQVWVIPLTTYIHGKKIAMGGIGNVASWPEHRRGGLVASLLSRSLHEMREAGQSVSFLTPFSFAFYRRYGWETYVDRKKYTMNTDQLPKIGAAAVSGSFERLQESDAAAVLSPIYEKYAARYTGMLSREESWWPHRVLRNRKGQLAVYKDDSGEAVGYLQYQVKNREFTVQEFVALTREAEIGLWRFIGLHESMIKQVVMYVPVDDGLPFELDDPRFKQEIEPYFMARIVDVEAFLRQYPFAEPGKSLAEQVHSVRFEVADEHAPWNNGNFELTVSADGSASVRKLRSESDGVPSDYSVRCSIQTLSALLMGYRSAEQLYDLGRINCDAAVLRYLSAIIPRRTTYLCDFF